MLTRPQDLQVASGHTCPILNIAHDYYGMRIATCSSDKTIRVFEKIDDGNWILASQWNAHKGIIWKVAWAHPEFGQVLASCSDDRTIMVWSEVSSGPSGFPEPKLTFQLMYTLTDFEKGVHSIAFAPNHMGLLLASGCNDGKVRVHSSSGSKADSWTLHSEFSPDTEPTRSSYISGLSWNKNRGDKNWMLAVGWWGAGEPLVSSVTVWGFVEERKEWQAVTRLDGALLAEVRGVDWAPACGRSSHLIAAAVGSSVQVWKVPSLSGWLRRKLDPVVPLPLEAREGAFGALPLWQVSWSITGSTLAASAEDGTVVVWKLDTAGQLQLLSSLPPK